jgi:hypothetical protein
MSFCTVATDSPQTVENAPSPSNYVAPVVSVEAPPVEQIPPHSDDTCGVYVAPTPDPSEGGSAILTFMAASDRIVMEAGDVITFNVGTGVNTDSQVPDYVQSQALDGTITKLPVIEFKILGDNSSSIPTTQGVITKSTSVEGEYTFTPATGFIGQVNSWTYTATDLGTTGVSDSDGLVSIRVVETGALANVRGLSWQGEWQSGIQYHDGLAAGFPNQDVVKLGDNGAMFVCIQSHVSESANAPTHLGYMGNSVWPGVWEMMIEDTTGSGGGLTSTPEGSLLSNLYNGALDWMKNATIGDWIQAVAVAAGVAVAGAAIIDAFTDTGSSGSNQDSRFTGSPSYTGAYTAPSLKTVVTSLCTEAGIASFDTSLLDDTIACHFSLSQVTSIRTILDNMSRAFQFDMVDSNGTLKFVPRNATVVRSLNHDDMGYNSSNDNVAPVTMKRLQSIDLPRKVSLTYIAEDLDYNNYTQSSEIPTFVAGNDITLSVPFMLSHADAKLAVDKLLIGAHLERMQYTFKTSYRNALDLEPGDVISIPEGMVRIIQIEEVDEGVLEMHCVDAGATGEPQPIIVDGVTIGYTASTYIGTDANPQLPQATVNYAPVISKAGTMWFDPCVQNSDDIKPRVYAAVHGFGVQGWPGAQIFVSKDGGGSYSMIAETNKTSTWGLVEVATPAAQWQIFDNVTQIIVRVKSGELVSKTDAAIQAGENRCMVGNECIAFGVATLISPGTYRLSHLMRGRQGTEWAVGAHQANELFVLMDGTPLELQFNYEDKGKKFLFKTVTYGSDLTKVDAQEIQIVGENLIPWTVGNLHADKVNDEWFVFWNERPRFNNTLSQYSTVTHDFDYGGFAVTIYKGATAVRQLIVYEPKFIYTMAMQLSDFGAVQTSLKVGLNQISNRFGGSRQSLNN